MSGGQKHALLYVPDYEANGGGQKSPLTYLALGAYDATHAHLSTARARGDDLLTEAGYAVGSPFFQDDARASQAAGGTLPDVQMHANGGTTLLHTGLTYQRNDGDPSPTAAASTRQGLTDELLTRGGWRDHTDGNRIVTVRGDKVDVVYGNYKRVVFGRVGPVAGAIDKTSSWEVSGGHIFEKTSTGVNSLTSIEWVQETDETGGDGTYWKVVETTEKGDLFVRYSGRVEEYFNGPSQTSKTGTDGADDEKNPHIREINWIHEKDSKTTADDVTEKTTVDDKSSITIGESGVKFYSFTHCLTTWSLVGYGDGSPPKTFDEQLWTKDQFNFNFFLVSLDFEVGGMATATAGHGLSLTFGLFFELGATAVDVDWYMGTKLGIRLGTSIDLVATGGSCSIAIPGPIDIGIMNTKVGTFWGKNRLLNVEVTGTNAKFGGVVKRLVANRNVT